MNKGDDCYKAEFPGETVRYCIEENDVWFYDEMSGGLYKLDKKTYIVKMILTPMEIHQKGFLAVLQIVKWIDKVYLIPNNLSREWLIYDIETRRIKWRAVSPESHVIGNVTRIDGKIYLIPEKTKQIVAIVDAETLSVNIFAENWYKKGKEELPCWGYSVFEDTISFPIIGTREMYQIQREEIIEIFLQIKYTVASISLSNDGIWILPSEGKSVFYTDRSGKLIESVEIRTHLYENSADRFIRIIAAGRYVYLFPKAGGVIWILEDKKNWIVMDELEEPISRPLYRGTRNLPFWGYYHEQDKLYTLPWQYRLAEISPEDKLIECKVLHCETPHIAKQYKAWVCWLDKQKESDWYVELDKSFLKKFLCLLREDNYNLM